MPIDVELKTWTKLGSFLPFNTTENQSNQVNKTGFHLAEMSDSFEAKIALMIYDYYRNVTSHFKILKIGFY